MNLKTYNSHTFFALLICILGLCLPSVALALPTSTYTPNSVLADGNWVKVSVSESGMHLITIADLKKWGFSDPAKVRIYGYGGARIKDQLTAANYIDDLPMAPSTLTSRGLMFYAQGPVTWSNSSEQYIHSINPYSTVGYYYLCDKDTTNIEIPLTGYASASDKCTTTFTEGLYHEQDLVSPGETGHILLGEDFRYNTSQNFNFELTDNAGNNGWLQCSFTARTYTAPSKVLFSVNGTGLESSSNDEIKVSANNDYIHGADRTMQKGFSIDGEKLTIGVTYKASSTVYLARLNYITVNYTRHIKMRNGKLDFRTEKGETCVKLAGATSDTHVWDVTDITNITQLNTAVDGDGIVWTNSFSSARNYSAWDESGTFPSPAYAGRVTNQNLHAIETPDMVIFTIADWNNQAERIAELHRNSEDSLNVVVVNQDDVFNEFSSGSADVQAFRKMLKMFWDRGKASGQRTLKYALFLGRGVYDNRRISTTLQSVKYPTMPIWQTDHGLSDNDSYSSDDMLAFLEDKSGVNISSDKLSIAIGRMPVRSSAEAKAAVDKLYKYVNNSETDLWKNQILIVADDDDNGAHMNQAESMHNNMLNSASGKLFMYDKLYIDAYEKIDGKYPDATAQMLRKLNEGVMWWNYIGHAGTSAWGHESLFTYTDICNLYIKRLPILYAATCEFMRWDAQAISGAEILFHNENGGVIAAISANRPVYISDNGWLSASIAEQMLKRDSNGNYLPVGEILRLGKNELKDADGKYVANSNKLRYALMGDPAMRFTTPSNIAVLETIDDKTVDIEDQVTIQARQDVTMKGVIYDAKGNKINDFNGIISTAMYDAETSTTTNGNGEHGLKLTFDEQGGRLFAGRDSVINGEFRVKLSMPSEIASNFRPAAFNMFAYSNDGRQATGCNRDFYVFGYDDNAESDTISPVISAYYLNHESFRSGDNVNESPMVIANISDNKGINLSSAGIGHQITLILDGSTTYNDVAQYYTPESSGGSIAYPLENLATGNHSLKLRVWDTSGNSAEETIDFFVEQGLAPKIYDVYADANPATTEANFYITHNRPDAMLTVTINVYNLLGRLEWTSTVTGRSDMFRSFPINWNLCDMAGRRIPRGIYVYKASITTDGQQYDTQSKRIAVAAQ